MRYIFFASVILILGVVGMFNSVRDKVSFVFAPIQFGLERSAGSIKDFFNFMSKVGSLGRENLRLNEQNLRLESQVLELKVAREENLVLKEQLGVQNPDIYDKKYVLAAVMTNASDTSGATLIIDKGSRQGVRGGSNVIKGNNLVGLIKEVTGERSKVELIVSPSSMIAAVDIDSATKTEGLATGKFATYVELQKILPSEVVNIGDSIVTSGRDGIFVPGLMLGRVSRVGDDPLGTLRVAYLEPVLDFSRLDKVFVLIDR